MSLIRGDAADLPHLLHRADADPGAVDVLVATYVLPVLPDDAPVWSALPRLAAGGGLRVGVADLGEASAAVLPLRVVFRLFAAVGGADPHRHPWERLAQQATLDAHETYYGGHVHLAVATYPPQNGHGGDLGPRQPQASASRRGHRPPSPTTREVPQAGRGSGVRETKGRWEGDGR